MTSINGSLGVTPDGEMETEESWSFHIAIHYGGFIEIQPSVSPSAPVDLVGYVNTFLWENCSSSTITYESVQLRVDELGIRCEKIQLRFPEVQPPRVDGFMCLRMPVSVERLKQIGRVHKWVDLYIENYDRNGLEVMNFHPALWRDYEYNPADWPDQDLPLWDDEDSEEEVEEEIYVDYGDIGGDDDVLFCPPTPPRTGFKCSVKRKTIGLCREEEGNPADVDHECKRRRLTQTAIGSFFRPHKKRTEKTGDASIDSALPPKVQKPRKPFLLQTAKTGNASIDFALPPKVQKPHKPVNVHALTPTFVKKGSAYITLEGLRRANRHC